MTSFFIFKIFKYIPEAIFIGVPGEHIINYIQLSHGGFEIGYNAKKFLDSKKTFEFVDTIRRATVINNIKIPEIKDALLATIAPSHRMDFVPKGLVTKVPKERYVYGPKVGFSWHEFISEEDPRVIVREPHPIIEVKSGEKWDREIVYGRPLVEYLLNEQSSVKSRLRATFRAHQHHNEMFNRLRKNKGFVSMWAGTVNAIFRTS